MSAPNPTYPYDDVEGVDLAILRAYDAWTESAEETGEDDIYGIGFGHTREGTSSLKLCPMSNCLTYV
jgi:hypothetical protein